MFVLFCLFALTLSQGVQCDPNFGKEYKYYLFDLGGSITVYTLNDATSTIKYTPCTNTTVKSENATNISYHTIDGETTKYAKELPAHVAYRKHYNGAQCTDANEIKGKYEIFLSNCIKSAVGGYEISSVEGGNLTTKFYTDANCKTPSTSMDPRTYKCDLCETDPATQKYICQALVPPSNPGTNPSNPATNTTTGKCLPDATTKYKYLSSTDSKYEIYFEFGKCINFGNDNVKHFKQCNETHVTVQECNDEGKLTGQAQTVEITSYGVKIYQKLPGHLLYATIHTLNSGCQKETGKFVPLTTDCMKFDSEYAKFVKDGDKYVMKGFKDNKCTQAGENANIPCGSCERDLKYECHEYGKSNGAVSSFLLMALALILFFF